MAVLVVSLVDKDARLRFVNYDLDTLLLDRTIGPRVKKGQRLFFHRYTGCSKNNRSSNGAAEKAAEEQERKGEGKEGALFERNSLSWLRAVRISTRCDASRIIQIIASKMIISDDRASTDLTA